MTDESPYENVIRDRHSFVLPLRKWRELLFIGAIVPLRPLGPSGPSSEDVFVRNPARPLPPFRDPDLFPEGVRFRVRQESNGRVRVERVD
jgi:hypothetical protein